MEKFVFPSRSSISSYDDMLADILVWCFPDKPDKQFVQLVIQELEKNLSHQAESIYPRMFMACAAVYSAFVVYSLPTPVVYSLPTPGNKFDEEERKAWRRINVVQMILTNYLIKNEPAFAENEPMQVAFYLHSYARQINGGLSFVGPRLWAMLTSHS